MRTFVRLSTPVANILRESHSYNVMSAHVLVVRVVGVDEGGLGLGVVIVLILVLLGLSSLKLNVFSIVSRPLWNQQPRQALVGCWVLVRVLGYCCFLTSLAI